jgi:hypothetical protein|tara:strand:- start:215 stop:442 length:228 start_codon:yes stop_codon:yes gene_type:complete
MAIVTVDDVKYESDLISVEGRSILSHLMEADKSLREASMTVGLMQAATVALMTDLKSNHLTDEALATEEVEATEE